MNLTSKKITVVGLGKSGFAAAKFLIGQKARVRVTDGSEKKEVLENASYLRGLGAEVETGAHTEAFVEGSQWIVASPGVSAESAPLIWAREKKIPIISEIELASLFCKGKIIAVTGSNGKTTTCHLIHRILTDAGRSSVLCGNVGFSFLDALPAIGPKTLVVLELSSFQLEASPTLRPEIAVVLNVSPNHLDRHKSMENYTQAKENIFKNQRSDDWLVLNFDNPIVKRMAKKANSRVVAVSKNDLEQGVFPLENAVVWKRQGETKRLFLKDSLALQGEHNLENAMCSAAVAAILKLSPRSVAKTLAGFRSLEHRIEAIGDVAGVHFVNDSKSTTIESTRAAIVSTPSPLILIAGGRDKGHLFSDLEPLLLDRVKCVVLYGEAREKIAASWTRVPNLKCERFFGDAVRLAFEEARAGDTILLSPIGTSFDQFSSFEHRGEVFKHTVKELRDSQTSAKQARAALTGKD
jgi:UDP-N-acetylmuramoylalanine--D-glutamate ligase